LFAHGKEAAALQLPECSDFLEKVEHFLQNNGNRLRAKIVARAYFENGSTLSS
jgi:hypothetical protein